MRYVEATLLILALWAGAPKGATAQRQASFSRWVGPPQALPSPRRSALMPADSVRQKVGYQHWKGAAIGAGVGAVLGSALAFGLAGECADGTVTAWDRAPGALLITGASSALGFLVGLASPRVRLEAVSQRSRWRVTGSVEAPRGRLQLICNPSGGRTTSRV